MGSVDERSLSATGAAVGAVMSESGSGSVVVVAESCVLAPSTKSEKKVRSILEGLCDTGNSMYWKSEDDAGAMGGLADEADEVWQ